MGVRVQVGERTDERTQCRADRGGLGGVSGVWSMASTSCRQALAPVPTPPTTPPTSLHPVPPRINTLSPPVPSDTIALPCAQHLTSLHLTTPHSTPSHLTTSHNASHLPSPHATSAHLTPWPAGPPPLRCRLRGWSAGCWSLGSARLARGSNCTPDSGSGWQ